MRACMTLLATKEASDASCNGEQVSLRVRRQCFVYHHIYRSHVHFLSGCYPQSQLPLLVHQTTLIGLGPENNAPQPTINNLRFHKCSISQDLSYFFPIWGRRHL
jgi:hypothetical protein